MDLVGYLETLPRAAFARLYGSAWTCQAVLRGLPPLAKAYVLRLVFVENPVPSSLVASWVKPEGGGEHRAALQRLQGLQILQPGPTRSGEATWQLHPDFRAQLRRAIAEEPGEESAADAIPEAVLQAAPSQKALDSHATSQWEALCLYLVGSTERLPREAPHIGRLGWMDTAALLCNARLMTREGEREITQEGFRFLMQHAVHQLWLLLRQYIEAAAAGVGERLAQVVSFLLQLGAKGPGVPLSTAGFEELQQSVAADLARLGLLLPFKVGGEVLLSPTRLALALGGGSAAAQRDVSGGFVVVETNYRVVAYTASPIRLAILRLFVRCDVVLPNAFIGTLTRESVSEAHKSGIDHEAIVRYLTEHAAPQVAHNVPIVPAVVADQVRLWQAELRRVEQHRAYLYDDFESRELFVATADQARLLGTLLWEDAGRQRLAAAAEGHAALRDFIKTNKAL